MTRSADISPLSVLLARVDAISDGSEEKARKQSDILIDLAGEADLFHAPDGTGYADVSVEGHRETWPIRSKGFRRWLTRRYYLETGTLRTQRL